MFTKTWTNEIEIRGPIPYFPRLGAIDFVAAAIREPVPVLLTAGRRKASINSRKANSRTVKAIRQPDLFNMAHFFALSLATVGERQPFEPLVQEFLKDDQQEFIFPTKKKKKWSWKRTAISRSEGLAFGTER